MKKARIAVSVSTSGWPQQTAAQIRSHCGAGRPRSRRRAIVAPSRHHNDGPNVGSVAPVSYSTSCHDRIFKAHIVKQTFDCSALRIGAAEPHIPITMGVSHNVPNDKLAERPPP